jgi:hypothetical protein
MAASMKSSHPDRRVAMTSFFMAVGGAFLLLTALVLWRLKVEPLRTPPLGTAVFSSRPSDFALTPKTASALVTAVGASLIVLSILTLEW